MSEEITFSARYGRPLTRTEIQVFTFMENEHEAIELSKFIVLPENATYEQIDEAVAMALAHRKLLGGGCPNVEGADAKRSDNRTYPAVGWRNPMSVATEVAATIYVASVPQPGRPNEDAMFVGRQAGAPLVAVFDGQGHAEGAAKKAARQLERLYTASGGRPDWTRTAKLLDSHLLGTNQSTMVASSLVE